MEVEEEDGDGGRGGMEAFWGRQIPGLPRAAYDLGSPLDECEIM